MYAGISRLHGSFIKVTQTSVNENRRNSRLVFVNEVLFMLHLDNFKFTSLQSLIKLDTTNKIKEKYKLFLSFNVFTVSKGSNNYILFAITAAGVVPCGGPKSLP